MNIINAIEKFCEYSKYMRGFSTDTIKRYRVTVRLLQKCMKIDSMDQCSDDRIRAFFYNGRVERKWSPNSFVTYHKSLIVFFRWCVQNGYLPSNPAEDIEMPKLEKKLPPKLTQQEASRLLEIVYNYPYPYSYLRYRNYAIFAVFIYAGLRKNELLHLRMSDVDLQNKSIFIRKGKGSKDRIIPMGSTLVEILERYLKERKRLNKTCPEFFTSLNRNMGLTETGMKRLVQLVRKESNISFSAHKLRHTFATLMLEGGCDIFSLSKMMGHSDIKTTTIYLAASPEHLRTQIVKHPLN